MDRYLTERFITQVIKTIDVKSVTDPSGEDSSLYMNSNTRIKGSSKSSEKNQMQSENSSKEKLFEKKPIESVDTIAATGKKEDDRLYERTLRYLYQKERNMTHSDVYY